MTLEQLQQQRDALRMARYQGVLTVRAGDKVTTCMGHLQVRCRDAGTSGSVRAALAAIDGEIAALEGRPRRRRLLTYGKKGF